MSGIRSEAYRFCKSIWKSPQRESLRNLIRNLNTVQPDDRGTSKDRSHFGYLARRQNAQLLGYLVVDQNRTKLENGPLPLKIPPLDDDERGLLARTHQAMLDLNRICLAPLIESLPKCVKAVDPYSKFVLVLPSDVSASDIFAYGDIDALVDEFWKHPAINAALADLSSIENNFTEEQYSQTVIQLSNQLEMSDPLTDPESVFYIATVQPKKSPVRVMIRHFAALLSIRASLGILNQMIYQAILQDRLPAFDKSNTIEIGRESAKLSGTTLNLLCQPTEQGIWAEPGHLVLTTSEILSEETRLWRVEGFEFESSQDFGSTMKLFLREINKHLNPFGEIYRHF